MGVIFKFTLFKMFWKWCNNPLHGDLYCMIFHYYAFYSCACLLCDNHIYTSIIIRHVSLVGKRRGFSRLMFENDTKTERHKPSSFLNAWFRAACVYEQGYPEMEKILTRLICPIGMAVNSTLVTRLIWELDLIIE